MYDTLIILIEYRVNRCFIFIYCFNYLYTDRKVIIILTAHPSHLVWRSITGDGHVFNNKYYLPIYTFLNIIAARTFTEKLIFSIYTDFFFVLQITRSTVCELIYVYIRIRKFL